MNIYAPADISNERKRFFKKLANIIENHTSPNSFIILGGNTNSM